jgi:hypothetical protein
MARKAFKPEQIINKLREVTAGARNTVVYG